MSDFTIPDIMDGYNTQASMQAVGHIDSSPDDAARSLELEKTTGVPATAINGDLESFERQHKSELAGGLIKGNQHLADYILSHPMAAQVSNDDYGNLDIASRAMDLLKHSPILPGAHVLADPEYWKDTYSIAKEGWASLGGDQESADNTEKFAQEQGASPEQAARIASTIKGRTARSAALLALPVMQTLAAPAIAMFRHQLSRPLEKATGFPKEATEGLTMAALGVFGLRGMHAEAVKVKEISDAVAPFVEAGVEPPMGAHPDVDQLKIKESEEALKQFTETYKASQASLTRERNPDLYANFARLKLGDQSIGVSADAVRKLYGDKVPHPEDGLLGFVPDLEAKLQAAEAVGGHVEVPLADYLAKVEPEVAKGLEEDIRVRPEGVTKNEAEVISKATQEETKLKVPVEEPAKEPNVAAAEPIQVPDRNDMAVNAIRKSARLTGPDRYTVITAADGSEISAVKTQAMTKIEKNVAKDAKDIINRILGKGDVKVLPADEINFAGTGKDVVGLNVSQEGMVPVIAYALSSGRVERTVRHEAIHQLMNWGLITKEEWAAVKEAAETKNAEGKDWLDKHNIRERYKDQNLDRDALVEEAFAEEFGEWGTITDKADKQVKEYSKLVDQAFGKIQAFFKELYDKIAAYFDHPPDVKDLFESIESGEVGKRSSPEAREGSKASEKEPELPGTRRMEDRDPFGPGVIGHQQHYLALIQKQLKEDFDATAKRAMEDQKRKLTAEWKKNSAEMRNEVADDVLARPDIAANRYFLDGLYAGEKVEAEKIGTEFVPEEIRKGLSPNYFRKGGASPDDIAPLFDFPSGQAMVEALVRFNEAKRSSGMRPFEYVRRLIDAETERRMETKYGKLGDKILEEAKEQVLSETQVDLLHEETLKLATDAGLEFTLTKEQIKAGVKDLFSQEKASDVSSDKFIADVGRAGRAMEEAFLKDDKAEAFRQKQRQYLATLFSREALELEKAKVENAKRFKRYAKREVGGSSQEYTNAIHAMMVHVGERVNRSLQDITEEMKKDGYDSFRDFVETKEDSFRELHVPEWLMDADPVSAKRAEDLTVQQTQELHDAMEAMTFNARDELKINKAGEKADLAEVLGKMVEDIKSLGEAKEYPIDRKESKAEYLKSWWWSGITVESMLNRLDRDNSKGIFNQTLVREFSQASNYKDKLIREFQGKISEIGKIEDMDKIVENPLFVDPITGEKFRMRRRNVLGILQQIGNESNLKKLTEGYKIQPQAVMDWLAKNTTKEDWDRAQKIGDIFKEIFDLADNMSHNVSGVGIQRLPLAPVQTPFGEYSGWYNPIKYDSLRPGGSKRLMGPNALEQPGFYRATTPQGYTKGRTGYIAPVELSLDVVPERMRQMLHDIAMRPAVIQLSKIFYDKRFQQAMIGHFGRHQAGEMIPFLQDIANAANFKSMEASYKDKALEYFRQNTIATLIGLNPGTVMKHGATAAFNSMTEVGPLNFARELGKILSDAPQDRANWNMAMEKSEELQRRMKNYTELVEGHGSEINIRGARSKFASYREFLINAGSTPVSISDLLSATPTWLAKYKTAIAEGLDEGQSVFEADRAVRRAHGSSVLSNKPSLARTNALGAWFSSLYGFFSHMQQKQYELAWKAKDLTKDTIGKGSGDLETATRHAPDLLKGFISYVIIPAVIEELVTPYTNSDKDSWGVKAAKVMALGMSASLIGVRDFAHNLINGRDPQAGLIGTTFRAGSDVISDVIRKKPMTKEQAAATLKHLFVVTGVLTGLTNASEGNIAQYVSRYMQGLERPKSPGDVFEGVRHGKTKRH